MTLAETNRNPLNLEITTPPTAWRGCDPAQKSPEQMGVRRSQGNRFVKFTEERWGWRAGAKNVLFHYRGGKNTIRKLIHAWSPPWDAVTGAQHTDAYVNAVARGSGLDPDAVVDMAQYSVISAIVWEMHIVEAGKAWGSREALDLGLDDIGIFDAELSVPGVPEPMLPPPPGKIMGEDGAIVTKPETQDKAIRAADTQKIVQTVAVAGTAATSSLGFFKIIPPWALGVVVVAIVLIAAVWALRSFGIVKRAV